MLKNFFRLVVLNRSFSSKITPRQKELMAKSLPRKGPLPGVKHIVVVASGKGGVGKSTTAVNLSTMLASMGKNIGILDADVFGPSVPLMMNVSEEPLVDDNNIMIPPINYGVKCMSMGLLAQTGAIVWRGPLVMSAIQRMLKGTIWSPLDILIVDTPPGTGDVHLSLAQNVPIDGVVLISTPQTAALEVTARGAEMYRKFNVEIIGLVENMQHVICDNCKTKIEIFRNVTNDFIKKNNIDMLVSIPMNGNITDACDSGTPMTIKEPNSLYTKSIKELAENVLRYLDSLEAKQTHKSDG